MTTLGGGPPAATPGWSPTGSNSRAGDPHFGIRCPRCARTQPPAADARLSCAYCGAALTARRWVAHPPPGLGPARQVRVARRRRPGPPAYGDFHPAWGFPPVVWRAATVGERTEIPPPPRALRGNATLAALTGAACLVAAAAETWRFVLLVRGRSWVLSGAEVRASDALVTWSGVAALVLAVATAIWTIPNLVALHRGSAVRNGRAPSRLGAGIVARLVVPGWNVYAAGQILAEIDGELAVAPVAATPEGRSGGSSDVPSDVSWTASAVAVAADAGDEAGAADSAHSEARWPAARRSPLMAAIPLIPLRSPPSRLVMVWWALWALNAVLVVITLVSAFWHTTQAMANTVEWHIAVDLGAAAVAAVLAAVLIRFERHWSDRIPDELAGWTVAAPPSTARNRRPAVPVASVASVASEASEGLPATGTSRASAASVPDPPGPTAPPVPDRPGPTAAPAPEASEPQPQDGPGSRLESGGAEWRAQGEHDALAQAGEPPRG